VWRHLPANPLWILWHARDLRVTRWSIRDVVVNIALYAPLGMSGYLALRRSVWLPVLLGFLLSVSMELVQLFVPGRDTSAIDVMTNVTGTIAGVALGIIFDKIAGPRRASALARFKRLTKTDRSALILLFIWAGYLLFPFFPVLGFYVPRQRMKIFARASIFAALPFISATVSWLAAGKLMDAAGIRSARLFLGLSILVIPAQFFIADRQPLPPDLLGALAGFLLFIGLGRTGRSAPWASPQWVTPGIATAFLVAILVRGLAPFHFGSQSSNFMWMPFSGFLNTEWQSGILILLEKFFYYGTAIWLLRASGIRLVFAAAITAAVLAAIEIAQIHLPGRTAEITDPLVAIMLAFALAAVTRDTSRDTNWRAG
jgi:VanZ family protein